MCKRIYLYLLPSLLIGLISRGQENSPKSHPPVKISLVVGFLLLCLTCGQAASGELRGFISPAQGHRAHKGATVTTRPHGPCQRQGTRAGLWHFMTVLATPEGFHPKEMPVTELKGFASSAWETGRTECPRTRLSLWGAPLAISLWNLPDGGNRHATLPAAAAATNRVQTA